MPGSPALSWGRSEMWPVRRALRGLAYTITFVAALACVACSGTNGGSAGGPQSGSGSGSAVALGPSSGTVASGQSEERASGSGSGETSGVSVPFDASAETSSIPNGSGSLDASADSPAHDGPDVFDESVGSDDEGGPVSHRFLNGFSDKGILAIVNADGTHAWENMISQGEANDAWLLPNGDVVFAFIAGAREVTPSKQTVWQYLAPSGAEVHSVQPLADDLFLIGESHADGTSYLYEMDRTTTISHTVKVTLGGSAHEQFREVRKTPQGTYITSQLGGKAREYDANGMLLNTYPCGSFVGIRLPDGNTLISCGDDHRLIEVNPQNAIVWEVDENDIPGNTLFFVAGLQRLPNGNTVVCNWPGHVGGSAQPQVFEITPDKKVVWTVTDPSLGWISNVEILDPQASFNGTVLR
jgi:hypothetical protein